VSVDIASSFKRLNFIDKDRFYKRTLQSCTQKHGEEIKLEYKNIENENDKVFLDEVRYV
jgi:hypothetical protein